MVAEGILNAGEPSPLHDNAATVAPPSALASKIFLSTLSSVRSTLSRTAHSEKRLRDEAWPSILKRIHGALDTGKPITGAGPGRGLPMDVVVQTLKAGWHVDGTWPIGPGAMKELEFQAIKRAEQEKGPEAKQDPSPRTLRGCTAREG